MKKISVFTMTMMSSVLLTQLAFADVGASKQISLTLINDGSTSMPIRYGDLFMDASALQAGDPYLRLFGLQTGDLQDGQKVFHGRAAYSVPIAQAKLNKSFFENIGEIQKLVGSGSQIRQVSQNPFVFQNSTSTVGGLVTMESNQQVNVYEQADLKSNPVLQNAIAGLNRRPTQPIRVVVQNASNFNHFVNRAFMVSLIYQTSETQSDIEVVSALLIDSLPMFGQGVIESTTKDDLVGYAQRLAKERP